MKLRKVKVPARRTWFLVCVKPNGERMSPYTGDVFRTERDAKKAAVEFNARRNVAKYGTVTYESRWDEEHVAYVGRIAL